LTGYDIKKRIDGAIRFFWKGSYGSIYPALAAMETEGLVTRVAETDSGGRIKGNASTVFCEFFARSLAASALIKMMFMAQHRKKSLFRETDGALLIAATLPSRARSTKAAMLNRILSMLLVY
ncbi:MAG: PadR family transcriptional regulator, partial [Treponema sp.]|nr:PadR family transcriptional regulator [Treponema sp.]